MDGSLSPRDRAKQQAVTMVMEATALDNSAALIQGAMRGKQERDAIAGLPPTTAAKEATLQRERAKTLLVEASRMEASASVVQSVVAGRRERSASKDAFGSQAAVVQGVVRGREARAESMASLRESDSDAAATVHGMQAPVPSCPTCLRMPGHCRKKERRGMGLPDASVLLARCRKRVPSPQ